MTAQCQRMPLLETRDKKAHLDLGHSGTLDSIWQTDTANDDGLGSYLADSRRQRDVVVVRSIEHCCCHRALGSLDSLGRHNAYGHHVAADFESSPSETQTIRSIHRKSTCCGTRAYDCRSINTMAVSFVVMRTYRISEMYGSVPGQPVMTHDNCSASLEKGSFPSPANAIRFELPRSAPSSGALRLCELSLLLRAELEDPTF